MRPQTIDACVVIAWLLDESRPGWVDWHMDAVRRGEASLLAPSLLWLEIGNRLARIRTAGDEFELEAMLRAESLDIEEIRIDRPLRLRTLTLAQTHQLSMYDATYLAVAEASAAPLLTLDTGLERAAESMGLGRDGSSHGISEPLAPDRNRPVDTTSLAAIGQALAEMRREYSV